MVQSFNLDYNAPVSLRMQSCFIEFLSDGPMMAVGVLEGAASKWRSFGFA